MIFPGCSIAYVFGDSTTYDGGVNEQYSLNPERALQQILSFYDDINMLFNVKPGVVAPTFHLLYYWTVYFVFDTSKCVHMRKSLAPHTLCVLLCEHNEAEVFTRSISELVQIRIWWIA